VHGRWLERRPMSRFLVAIPRIIHMAVGSHSEQLYVVNKNSAVAETGDRLTTMGMVRKVGRAAVALSVGGSWVSI